MFKRNPPGNPPEIAGARFVQEADCRIPSSQTILEREGNCGDKQNTVRPTPNMLPIFSNFMPFTGKRSLCASTVLTTSCVSVMHKNSVYYWKYLR